MWNELKCFKYIVISMSYFKNNSISPGIQVLLLIIYDTYGCHIRNQQYLNPIDSSCILLLNTNDFDMWQVPQHTIESSSNYMEGLYFLWCYYM